MSPNDVPLTLLAVALASTFLGSLFAGADTALTSLSATRIGALIEQSEGIDRAAFERLILSQPGMRSTLTRVGTERLQRTAKLLSGRDHHDGDLRV